MPGFSSQSPICCIGASPLWAPDDGDKEFLVSGYASTRKAAMVGLIVSPGRLEHLGAGSPTPRLASPAAPSARWSQCTAWHGSEVVPPGSSLVEIDLIEQPDGTLPAPDPHRPAQCRVG